MYKFGDTKKADGGNNDKMFYRDIKAILDFFRGLGHAPHPCESTSIGLRAICQNSWCRSHEMAICIWSVGLIFLRNRQRRTNPVDLGAISFATLPPTPSTPGRRVSVRPGNPGPPNDRISKPTHEKLSQDIAASDFRARPLHPLQVGEGDH